MDEGAAYGAALLGGVAAGVWDGVGAAADACVRPGERIAPVIADAEVYAESRARFRALYPALQRIDLTKKSTGLDASGMVARMSSITRSAALVAAALSLVAAAPAAAERYVALGDSYSSGTGTRTYFDSGCQKSVYSYPYLLSQQRPNTQLVFAACSGAQTSNVLDTQVQQPELARRGS